MFSKVATVLRIKGTIIPFPIELNYFFFPKAMAAPVGLFQGLAVGGAGKEKILF